jgi:hypothetical protein
MAKQAAETHEPVETLEQGNIYFLYRPRVEHEEAKGPQDVQHLYCVLSPYGVHRYRLLIIGRHQLPDPAASGRARFWAFVSLVRSDPKQIADELGEYEYDTKTRGHRHQPAARAAAEGVYRLVRHGDHTHLVYALERPLEPGKVQRDLGIHEEASYIISVKNPSKPSPKNAGLPKRDAAQFPKKLQKLFAHRKFASVETPELLDHEGAELLLIGASDDVTGELGIQLDPRDDTGSRAKILRDLRLRKSEHPIEPLLEGEWT